MNKANGTGLENNTVVMKTACTAVKRKFIVKREANLYTVHVHCILAEKNDKYFILGDLWSFLIMHAHGV